MLRIAGGSVYDPANGIAGEVRDVCVEDGKIVADVPAHARRIDARGMVVMPGGVDIHAHIAGPKVNAARKLLPEEHRADVLERTAITALGHRRHRPLDVRHRLPLRAARLHDRGRGRHPAAGRPPHARRAARHAGDRRRSSSCSWATTCRSSSSSARARRGVREAIAWWLQATGGYGVKLVNPGGVEMWKRGNGNVDLARRRRSRGHAAPGHRDDRHRRPRARAAAPRARPLQQPRRAGQRPHHARHAAHARRAAAPTSPTCSSTPTAGGPAGGRARGRPSSPSTSTRHPELSADVGQVMFGAGDDDDRRRAGLRRPARHHARPLGQRRHRGRDRLRDRPVHLPRARTTSTRCSGASGSSCSCSAATRGGSCCRPTTPTAARS